MLGDGLSDGDTDGLTEDDGDVLEDGDCDGVGIIGLELCGERAGDRTELVLRRRLEVVEISFDRRDVLERFSRGS